MKKRICILFLIFLLLFTSLYFSKANNNKNKKYNFIFVCTILNNDYWQTCIEGIEQADEELGTTTKVLGSKDASNFSTEIVRIYEAGY